MTCNHFSDLDGKQLKRDLFEKFLGVELSSDSEDEHTDGGERSDNDQQQQQKKKQMTRKQQKQAREKQVQSEMSRKQKQRQKQKEKAKQEKNPTNNNNGSAAGGEKEVEGGKEEKLQEQPQKAKKKEKNKVERTGADIPVECETCKSRQLSDLWLCLHCASMFCLSHSNPSHSHDSGSSEKNNLPSPSSPSSPPPSSPASSSLTSPASLSTSTSTSTSHLLTHIRHTSRGKENKCHLVLSCQDSHIFCCTCCRYLYPREVAGGGGSGVEGKLTTFAEKWLQIYGRTRLWWRSSTQADGTRCQPFPGRRGLTNFGNTCFFTSTMQSLLHLSPLRDFLLLSQHNNNNNNNHDNDNDDEEEKDIQKALRRLFMMYYANKVRKADAEAEEEKDKDKESENIINVRGINPKAFWSAVKENALFGQYDDDEMEDANSLLIDVLNGLNDDWVAKTFGFCVVGRVACVGKCETLQLQTAEVVNEFFHAQDRDRDQDRDEKKNQTRIGEIISSYTIGAVLYSPTVESTLSLAISHPVNNSSSSSNDSKNDSNKNESPSTPPPAKGEKKKKKKSIITTTTTTTSKKDDDEQIIITKMKEVQLEEKEEKVDDNSSNSKESSRISKSGERIVELEEIMKDYFTQEPVPDYRCAHCSEKGKAYKRLEFHPGQYPPPPVLLLHLKRFAPVKAGVQVKCHRKVRVPLHLDLGKLSLSHSSSSPSPSPSPSTAAVSPLYRVSGMVVHDGGMGGGHYMAYIREWSDSSPENSGRSSPENSQGAPAAAKEISGRWMWFSDRSFGPVEQAEIDDSEPYIVTYERVQ